MASETRETPVPETMAAFFKHDLIDADAVSTAFKITKVQLADAAGLATQSVTKTRRAASPATQQRLREMTEIVWRVAGWAGSPVAAFAWYRSQPLPPFGDLTAEDLVKSGRAEAVRRYLSAIAEGGYA